jgi:hypothetical protein
MKDWKARLIRLAGIAAALALFVSPAVHGRLW